MEERFFRSGAVEPKAERREIAGFVRFLGAGILRLIAYTAVATAIAGGAGVAWGALRGSDDLLHSFVLGLWVGGATMVGLAVLTGGREVQYRGELGEDLGTSSSAGMGAFVVIGIIVIAIGIAIDVVQRG